MTTPGWSSTTSSRSTRTRRHPRSFWARPASGRAASGSATASSSCPRITRSGWPSASPRSISSRAAGSSWGSERVRGRSSFIPSAPALREKRDVWEESVKALVPAFTRETWEWHGTYFDFPARNVIPKPYQKPHPPLWVACSNITTIGNAGRWGMGELGFQFVSPEAARAWVNRYYINLTRDLETLADYPVNPNIAMVSGFMCAATDEEAQAKASGWTFFVFCLSHYGKHGIPNPGQGNMWELYQEWRHTEKAQETLRSGLIGSPETIRRRLREFEAAHVDQVILLNQAGRTTREDICQSLEL